MICSTVKPRLVNRLPVSYDQHGWELAVCVRFNKECIPHHPHEKQSRSPYCVNVGNDKAAVRRW